MNSSGTLKAITLDGNVNTSWGNAIMNGVVAPKGDNFNIDIDLTGENIDPGAWIDVPWLGNIDLKAERSWQLTEVQAKSELHFVLETCVQFNCLRNLPSGNPSDSG